MKPYIKKDLTDYEVDNPVVDDERYYTSRTDVIEALLPEEAEIHVHSTGNYQGSMGFVIELDDYLWLIKESYGSCSYCDGFIGSKDEMEYGLSMLRNAYCLESKKDAHLFLDHIRHEDSWGWGSIADGVIDILEKDV